MKKSTLISTFGATFLLMISVVGCETITTNNPTNPEADSPFVFGDKTATPYGCIKWKILSDMGKLPPLKPTTEEGDDSPEEESAPGWDC